MGQLPSTWGTTRFRPPCKVGLSWVLMRAGDAYRSWKDDGSGGRLFDLGKVVAASCWYSRFLFSALGGRFSFEFSGSESEEE